MVLLRHLLGDVLRRLRLRQGRTLREVSASARVSLGYLSEVERGQKEASSELLSAICTALDTPLSHVLREVSDNFALAELQNAPVLTGPREPVLHADRPPAAHLGKPAQTALVASQDSVLDAVRLHAGRPGGALLGRDGPGLGRVADDGAFERISDDRAFDGVPDDTRFDGLTHSGDVSTMVPV